MRIRIALLSVLCVFMSGTWLQQYQPGLCYVDDCVWMLLPPMPSYPDDDTQVVRFIPYMEDAGAETFRLAYGTSRNSGWSYSPDSNGVSCNHDERHEFSLSSLTPDTQYYFQLQIKQGTKWEGGRQWSGGFKTMPSSGGTINFVVVTDIHWLVDDERDNNGFALLSQEQDWADVYLGLGDDFMIHAPGATGVQSDTDWFGRYFGARYIGSAVSSSVEDGYAEARYSALLRRMWYPILRNVPQLWVRGNHDAGGSYGNNVGEYGHYQFRERPWDEPGPFAILLGSGHDLSAAGVFTEVGHGLSEDDGPYRFADTSRANSAEAPTLTGCGGSRPSENANNEWYIHKESDDTFTLSYDTDTSPCDGVSDYGSGTMTLVTGSDMKSASHAVIEKYMPHISDIATSTWNDTSEIMGEIPVSDHILVLMLDPYEHTPQSGTCTPDSEGGCWPVDGRTNGAGGGWSYGTDQQAGIIAAINEVQDGDGAYENVETIILISHALVGGYDFASNYNYGRGTICEVDTECVIATGTDCVTDADCVGVGDSCEPQDCTEDFAHSDWQAIQTALANFVTRTGGIALVMVGHDHIFAFGEKASSGVYYLTAGRLGSGEVPTWYEDPESLMRYDFTGVGTPVYMCSDAVIVDSGVAYPCDFSGMDERGTLHPGYVKLSVTPAAESESGKTEALVDYVINARYEAYPWLHGRRPTGFPFTIYGD